jgi:carboxypeptidase Q
VEAHKDELPKISGALIHDTGTGKVVSIGMMGNYQDREIMDQVVAPLHDLGFLELSLREMNGSDHASFDRAGVPGFWVMQDVMDYAQTHHSQADTFDRVVEEDLAQGAQVLAVWAYNVAQLPELLPRKPTPATPPINPNAPPTQTTPPARPK